jgi:hypothetical protein
VSAGANVLTFTVPAGYATGAPVFARFRLYPSQPSLAQPAGLVTNGEVEDYYWTFAPTAVTLNNLSARSESGLNLYLLLALAPIAILGGLRLALARRRV